jgi:hypothetical protein
MTVYFDGRRTHGDLMTELARLESLIVDLRYLAEGHTPDDRHLEAAPVIDHWMIRPHKIPAIHGIVSSHPTHGNVPHVAVKLPLEILAADLGWARTGRRLYRLGYQAGQRPLIAN